MYNYAVFSRSLSQKTGYQGNEIDPETRNLYIVVRYGPGELIPMKNIVKSDLHANFLDYFSTRSAAEGRCKIMASGSPWKSQHKYFENPKDFQIMIDALQMDENFSFVRENTRKKTTKKKKNNLVFYFGIPPLNEWFYTPQNGRLQRSCNTSSSSPVYAGLNAHDHLTKPITSPIPYLLEREVLQIGRLLELEMLEFWGGV